jgi:hypothetical protein
MRRGLPITMRRVSLLSECKKGMMGVVEVYSPIRDGPSREKAA